MNHYFIYAHTLPDGKVFYVGKGSGQRHLKTSNRSVYWKRIVKKYGYRAIILENNLSEEQAYQREIYWIEYYKDNGQCFANFTNGGDGVRVTKRWWGDAISQSMRGKKGPRGMKSSSYKNVISVEELSKCYIELKMSSVAIGDKFKITPPTVLSRLQEYGIEIRKPGKARRCIRCINDGKVFPSISETARYYNLFRENISKVLSGKYKHTGGKRFEQI